jgi:hypothetical protein
MSLSLLSLKPLPEYGRDRAHIFPSQSSLEWFVRMNRNNLVENGALLVICGRRMVNPALFDDAVLRVGQSSALREVVHEHSA